MKIRRCIPIMMEPLDFLEKFVCNNFCKSVVLSVHYQLAAVPPKWRQDELDGRSWLELASLSLTKNSNI